MNSAQTNPGAIDVPRKTAFDRDGFLTIPALTTAEDIARIRGLLDPLFARFETLGPRAVDIAGPYLPGAAPRSPEIGSPSALAPELLGTLAFHRCREAAQQLLGVPVTHVFDHAIYKAPHSQAATGWHQDQVYAQGAIAPRSVHFWIPLQAVTVENGCMWYVPGSQRRGLLAHRVANQRTVGSTRTPAGATMTLESVDDGAAVACPLPLGGVAIHQPLTFHYAGPNQTDEVRRAWILHFGAARSWREKLRPRALLGKARRLLTGG